MNKNRLALLIICIIACLVLICCGILLITQGNVGGGIFAIALASLILSVEALLYARKEETLKSLKINYAVIWLPMLLFGGIFGLIAYFILLYLHKKQSQSDKNINNKT